jgi:manganese/zinc/iron transport system substrate-binding protein
VTISIRQYLLVCSALLVAGACGPTATVTETPEPIGGSTAAQAPSTEMTTFDEGAVDHDKVVAPPVDPAAIPPADHEGQLRVVTTVGQITDAAEFIGGDRVIVDQIVPGEDDPHLYVPSPRDVATLSAAHVIFYNGLFLEGQFGETLEQMQNQGIVTVPVTSGFGASHLLDREYSPGQWVTDPHVWFDPDLWGAAASNVSAVLSARDPAGASDYARRVAEYNERLAALRDWGRTQLEAVPEMQRILVTSHDAFNYFGRSFGVEVRGLQGLSTEVEAGTRDVIDLAAFIAERGIPAVFVEASVSPEALQAVVAAVQAEGGDVRIGGRLFSDTPGRRGTVEGTYPGMVMWNVATVTQALGGNVDAASLPASFLEDETWDFRELVERAVSEAVGSAADH